MSNVTLSIGGRSYTVACAEGEEGHVSALGRLIDEKVSAIAAPLGQNEVRQLLFASLLLADELHEARQAPSKAAPAPGRNPSPAVDLDELVAPALERMAERVENLATRLEALPDNA